MHEQALNWRVEVPAAPAASWCPFGIPKVALTALMRQVKGHRSSESSRSSQVTKPSTSQ